MSSELPQSPPPPYEVATSHYPGNNRVAPQPLQTTAPATTFTYSGAQGTGFGHVNTVQPYGYGVVPTVIQQPVPGSHTVTFAGASVLNPVLSSREPVDTVCQHCGSQNVTQTEATNGQTVICCVIILAVMGCWCGCCLVPLCVPSCKDVEHYCPHCNQLIGTCRSGGGGHRRARHY